MTSDIAPRGSSVDPDLSASRRPRKRSGCLIALAIVLAPLAYFMSPLHDYMSWLTMDVASLNREIDSHMRSVHGDTYYACLYAVSCDGGQPRLTLRTEITPADLDHIKSEVWKRRFEDYCTGQVTNFGLEHSHTPSVLHDGVLQEERLSEPPRDCYSFGGGFGGASGIMSGCAFYAERSEPRCTRDLAYWTREHGIVARR